MIVLILYDMLSCCKWFFELIDFECVIFYVCGLIVYNYVYIGNVCFVVVFDVFVCVLCYIYGVDKVIYVCNIIDVDDKIIVFFKEIGELIEVIMICYVEIYCQDMGFVGVVMLDIELYVIQYIL